MKTIGLDIGTTSICGIMIDSVSGELIESRTRMNDSNISDTAPWEKCQDPSIILAHCKSILDDFMQSAGADSDDIVSIGITGQMHGIVYLDSAGKPVSPLYTWQDERGSQPFSESNTYASYLSRVTGYPMATGYGMTTHFYLIQNDLVSEKATVFCSISDYVAMSLVHAASPVVHASDAASFGLFDVEKNAFDGTALLEAGIDPSLLPVVTNKTQILDRTPDGIPVSVAIGDNQASFLGSVCDTDAILVNVGTGSQVSVRLAGTRAVESIQIRPFTDGDTLCVGSPLCGGYSYSVLKEFFAQSASLLGADPVDLYKKMNTAAQALYPCALPLLVDTRFRGTRENPHIRGRIENISPANLTPGHLCLGVLKGICDELYTLYQKMPADKPRTVLIGSGNGIRCNPLMQQIFTDTFGIKLQIPRYREEAAYGAGLFSLCAAGLCHTLQEAQAKIKYQQDERVLY
ncbi:MAG: FGGY family carbohydrate kinase [Eubacteriales bacterium]